MDALKLKATLGLDTSEYEENLKGASSKATRLGGGLKAAMKVGIAAVGAASAAIGVLTKQSISAYAEYEQLAGGVKKLYGDAADELMGYAENAYKTSGMSANKYMEQATSFSAALINSLGGDTSAAAKQTDVAMKAIADNFNTFGGDIANVQNAYQGFAKQNYTMLDNLKLGYGGTKTEMERLIADANEYAQTIGMAGDLSIESFSDIVTAIDLVQQKQGIAGATAAEAATTIEGSFNMTKAAWDNLIAGFANPNADMGQLMDNLIVAILGDKDGTGLLNQLIPAVQRAVEGLSKFIQAAIPALAGQLPTLIQTFLPVIIQSAVALVSSLIQALPGVISTLVAMLPDIIDMVINGIIDALATAVPVLVAQMPQMVKAIASGLIKAAGTLVTAGGRLIELLATAITNKISSLASKAASFAKKIPEGIKKGLGDLKSAGANLIEGLWGGIKAKFDSVVNKVKALAAKLPTAVKKVLGIASPSKVFRDQIGKNIPLGIAVGIEKSERAVGTAMHDLNKYMLNNAPDLSLTPSINLSSINDKSTNAELEYATSKPKVVNIYNYITVNGAEDPELWADKLVRRMRLDMRTA